MIETLTSFWLESPTTLRMLLLRLPQIPLPLLVLLVLLVVLSALARAELPALEGVTRPAARVPPRDAECCPRDDDALAGAEADDAEDDMDTRAALGVGSGKDASPLSPSPYRRFSAAFISCAVIATAEGPASTSACAEDCVAPILAASLLSRANLSG